MAIANKPDENIFASNAKRGEMDTFPDVPRGWGISFDQTQGIPPMEWFNYLFNRGDLAIQYLMQRGLPEWTSSQTYPANAYVQHNGKSYRALRANQNQHPDAANSQDWKQWGMDFADIQPLTLTATSRNTLNAQGHTHEIAHGSTTQKGLVQLTNDTGLDSEELGLSAKGAKKLAQQIAQNQLNVAQNYIPNSKKSDAVNSNSSDTVATSKAVKTAYDKGVEAKTAADNALNVASGKWTKQRATDTLEGTTVLSHKTDGSDKNKAASEFALGEVGKKSLPLGSVVAFPKAVTHPAGFLLADGSTFNQATFPDLYQALGNSNRLPNLQRSDVGAVAWFAVDNIPDGWIPFDEISQRVSPFSQYSELYFHLTDKYGSIDQVPKVADRFIRNAGEGLNVGQVQEDAIRNITGEHFYGIDADVSQQILSNIISRNNNKSALFIGTESAADSTGSLSWAIYSANKFNPLKFDASRVVPTADENRPKSLVLKLCIKALNRFDEVKFWIKAYGEVTNLGELDAGRLAQGLQDKADRNHLHTASQISDFNQKTDERINDKLNQAFTYQKIGNFEIRKYPDGTMIQTYHHLFSNTGGSSMVANITWAQAFVSSPYTFATVSEYIGRLGEQNISTANKDTLNATVTINKKEGTGFYLTVYDSDYHSYPVDVDVVAIGRWK